MTQYRMADKIGEAERVIETLGCGPFQVTAIFTLFVLCNFPAYFSGMFMVYGNYNPGWRCLDNVTSSNNQSAMVISYETNVTHVDAIPMTTFHSSAYTVGSCASYEACQRVEFNPESSTPVTEWGLLCDRSWILSVILCLQMAGMMLGAYVAGQLEDKFGRKKVLYATIGLNGAIHLVNAFSVSWHMFAVLQCFSGFLITASMACYYVQLQEFLTKKWRGPGLGVPAFHVAGTCFAVTAMWLKDWRFLHLAATAVCGVAFVPVVWVPESLRWLEVNNDKEGFRRVAEKIAAMNSKTLPPLDEVNFIVDTDKKSSGDSKIKRHKLLDLCHRGYRLYTFIITLHWFSVSCVFYATYFAVEALYGNFYINLLIMDAMEIPFSAVRMAAPNVIGRKKSTITYLSVTSVCLYSMAGLFAFGTGDAKTTGTVVLAMIAKMCIHGVFNQLYTNTTEIYPTVVRGISVGWGSTLGRLGGFVSAFLIPNDPETFHIIYSVLATICLISCVATLGLPETRGKPLKETFDDDEETELDQIAI